MRMDRQINERRMDRWKKERKKEIWMKEEVGNKKQNGQKDKRKNEMINKIDVWIDKRQDEQMDDR